MGRSEGSRLPLTGRQACSTRSRHGRAALELAIIGRNGSNSLLWPCELPSIQSTLSEAEVEVEVEV